MPASRAVPVGFQKTSAWRTFWAAAAPAVFVGDAPQILRPAQDPLLQGAQHVQDALRLGVAAVEIGDLLPA